MKILIATCLFLLLASTAMAEICPGVPADVVSEIKQSVAGRHPNNFSVQKALLTQQCHDYLALHHYDPGIPEDVYKNIKHQVSGRHKYNYSVQFSLIKKQCEDYKSIQ